MEAISTVAAKDPFLEQSRCGECVARLGVMTCSRGSSSSGLFAYQYLALVFLVVASVFLSVSACRDGPRICSAFATRSVDAVLVAQVGDGDHDAPFPRLHRPFPYRLETPDSPMVPVVRHLAAEIS